MTPRFTVIQGGLSADAAPAVGPAGLHLSLVASDRAGAYPVAVTADPSTVARTTLETAGAKLHRRLADLRRDAKPAETASVAAMSPGRPASARPSVARRAIPAQAFLGVRPEGWDSLGAKGSITGADRRAQANA